MEKIKNVIKNIAKPDAEVMEETQKLLDNLTKPRGSLGRLEELTKKVAGITGSSKPELKNRFIVTMAGDHGVTAEGISAYPSEVTPQMVMNFLNGGAGINVLSKHAGAEVVVVDMGVASEMDKHPGLILKKIAPGTQNMAKGPAMTGEQAIKSIEAGISVVEGLVRDRNCGIVGTGDMGIGNTTPSSAITAVMCDSDIEPVTGRGTGIDDKALKNKIEVIRKAIEINKPDRNDPIDILAKIGGFEIGGIAGVILGAALLKIPVVIDGFISGAGALIAAGLEPKTKDYMIAAHCSVEIGHKILLDKLGLKPVLDLGLRLGEGTGAALGISIIDAGIKILNEMATFGDAGVSEKSE